MSIVSRVAHRSVSLLSVAVSALLLAGTAALAQPSEESGAPAPFSGNYFLRAEAYGGRLLVNLPHYLVIDPLVQGSVPRAFAELASSGSLAEASSIDAGPPEYLLEGAPALLLGLSLSGPAYPLLARARNDETDGTNLHLDTEYGRAGVGRAVAGPSLASADATAYEVTLQGGARQAALLRRSLARLEAGLPAALRVRQTALGPRSKTPALARFASVSHVSLTAPGDGVPALATSRSDVGRLEALGGLLVVEGVESEVRVKTDGRHDAAVAPTTRLGRAHFGEIEVVIDRDGLHVQDNVVGREALDSALQRALADARISITAPGVTTERLGDGTTRVVAEGLRLQFLFDLPTVNPDNVVAVSAGGAEAVFAVEPAALGAGPESQGTPDSSFSPPVGTTTAPTTGFGGGDGVSAPVGPSESEAFGLPGGETGGGFAAAPLAAGGVVAPVSVDPTLGTAAESEGMSAPEQAAQTALGGEGVTGGVAARTTGAAQPARLLPAAVAGDVSSLALLPVIAIVIILAGVAVLRLRL